MKKKKKNFLSFTNISGKATAAAELNQLTQVLDEVKGEIQDDWKHQSWLEDETTSRYTVRPSNIVFHPWSHDCPAGSVPAKDHTCSKSTPYFSKSVHVALLFQSPNGQ